MLGAVTGGNQKRKAKAASQQHKKPLVIPAKAGQMRLERI
jgi:hypothetical protein